MSVSPATSRGVHLRSDYTELVRLGEEVALWFLHDYLGTYNERVSCTVTRFDGTRCHAAELVRGLTVSGREGPRRLPAGDGVVTFITWTAILASMDKVIQATEANRQFSHLLRDVREGQSYPITSRGVPVNTANEARFEARKRLLERLRSQPAIDSGPWTRDELYER